MEILLSRFLLTTFCLVVTAQDSSTSPKLPTTSPGKGRSPTTSPSSSQDLYTVNLEGGRIKSEGKVMLTLKSTGMKFAAYFTSIDGNAAKVVCKTLNYKGGVAASYLYFGSQSHPEGLRNLICDGTELDINGCNNTKTVRFLPGSNTYPIGGVRCFKNKTTYGDHPIGYPAVKRPNSDDWSNAVFIMNPNWRLSHTGYVTAWHFYPHRAGTVNLQVWRRTSFVSHYRVPPVWSRSHYYFLVGQTKITVTNDMVNPTDTVGQTFPLNETTKIPFMVGDVIGMHFSAGSIINYSSQRYCNSYSRTLYTRNPTGLKPTRRLYFRQKSYGWNPCRMYSVYATVQNTTVPIEKQVTLPKPTTTPLPTIPASIQVNLTNGRIPSEGLVLVSQGNGDTLGHVCDDGWDNREAAVVCRAMGYPAGGIAKYQPFFGQGNGSIHLDDLVCNGNETSLSQCTTPRGWKNHNCRHREDAGVECIPNSNQKNDSLVFGYPAVNRIYKDHARGQAYILDPSESFPFSGSTIYQWNVYLKSTDPVYLQVYRLHQPDPATSYGAAGTMQYMLLSQTEVGKGEITHEKTSISSGVNITVKAGDLIGIHFPNGNPIPYDNRMRCIRSSRSLYMEEMANTEMKLGTVYTFKRKLSMYSPCRIFSVYAKYHKSKYEEVTDFQYNKSDYWIATDVYTQGTPELLNHSSNTWCTQTLGADWRPITIDSVGEMNAVNEALNTIATNSTVNYWIVPPEEKAYSKWGYCEPASGKTCTALSNFHHGSGSFSGFDFHMYNKECTERAFVICERDSTKPAPRKSTVKPSSTHNKGEAPVTATSTLSMMRTHRGFPVIGSVTGAYNITGHHNTAHGNSGTIAAVMVSLLVLVILAVVAFIIYRRRNSRKYDESRVHFMHLDHTEHKL